MISILDGATSGCIECMSVMRTSFVFAKVVPEELEDVEEPLFLPIVGLKITKVIERWTLSNLIGRLFGERQTAFGRGIAGWFLP